MADLQRKSYNLFDKNATDTSNGYEANSYINANGETGASINHNISEYIDISGYSTLTISGGQISSYSINNTFYNTNKEKISWFPCTTMPITVNVPNNAKYIRITISKTHVNTIMLNSGSTAKSYEPYGWVHSLRKLCSATEAVENPLYSDGTAITAYTIKGNTVQNGTPTPSNPITISGVGNKTANLFDKSTALSGKYIDDATGQVKTAATNNASDYIDISGLSSVYISLTSGSPWGAFYDANKDYVSGIDGYGVKTIPNNAKYMRLTIKDADIDTFMVSATQMNYEPYGYKIPISNGQGSAVNYLGSVQSTRQINKIVFDGTETGWDKGTYAFYYTINDMYIRSQVICTHYEYYDGTSSSAPTNSISTASGVGTSIWIKTADHDTTTLDQWKAYLQAQYAAGTPVTVYYVLATPTTGIVNEPLMKIGDYADTISNATPIPTTEGANTISVDTTVQPSEFTATWTGWHDSSVKEYDGSDWQ